LVLVVSATRLFRAKEATATIPFFRRLLQQAAVAVLGLAWETEIAVGQVVAVRVDQPQMEVLEPQGKVMLEETIKAAAVAQARQETQTEQGKVETVLHLPSQGHQ
jgi:hypothetical protein